jgi:hypothetical protein
LPTNAISGRAALGNGLRRELPAESVYGMWQMGGKACWEAGARKNEWGRDICH